MNKVIKNCLVTRSDASVLKEFCIDVSSPLYKQYKGFNTSVNLEATSVYSMYSGVVSMICKESNLNYLVGVLINANQAIMFGNLKSINVRENQTVDVVTKIGEANKFVKVYYMTTFMKTLYTYRIGNILMYKDDPMKILDFRNSQIQDTSPQFSESGIIEIKNEYDQGLNPSMIFMLSDNRGDR